MVNRNFRRETTQERPLRQFGQESRPAGRTNLVPKVLPQDSPVGRAPFADRLNNFLAFLPKTNFERLYVPASRHIEPVSQPTQPDREPDEAKRPDARR